MSATRKRRSIFRRAIGPIFFIAAIALIAVAGRCFYAFRDRNPGYALSLNIDSHAAAADPNSSLQVGFGRVKITPDLSNPKAPVWLAGFSNHRAATAVHDDLWAVALVIDDGLTRLGIVALDSIGFFNDDVIAVRQRLGAQLKLNYTIVCSTHNHSTPDLMGLWGPTHLQTGVNSQYREQVIDAAANALAEAVEALAPARVAFHEIAVAPEGLVTDSRKPIVFDPDLRVMHFTHAVDGSTLGTLVAWADHPETPWGQNTEITADFPGYLRDALENGVREGAQQLALGVGGIHLYVNGAIGGLMTTSPRVTVEDPYLKQSFQEPSHAKARALGRQLASRILPVLQQTSSEATNRAPISVWARTFEVPVDNKLFLLAPILGVIDRGHPGLEKWDKLRSELALVTLGDAALACIPGEIYPELVNGGIENPPGADFEVEPLEVAPLRELMPGRIKFIIGLANDEIGYIIPKSEWDHSPPYLYHADHAPYGEINSVGPDAASVIHENFESLCRLAE